MDEKDAEIREKESLSFTEIVEKSEFRRISYFRWHSMWRKMRSSCKSGEERILFKQDAPDTYQPFTSATQSGVEIEKNGNLLITNTDYSQIWEVTPQGEPVLKIYTFSPYLSNELSSYVFRTESYDFASLKKMGLAGSAN